MAVLILPFKSFSTAYAARFIACVNANSSAEPWLLKTTPSRPTSAAPLYVLWSRIFEIRLKIGKLIIVAILMLFVYLISHQIHSFLPYFPLAPLADLLRRRVDEDGVLRVR